MKRFMLTFLSALLFTAINAQSGFSTINNLSPLSIIANTAEIQQSKVWTYAGKHWAVLTSSTSGTVIYRLDGTNWVNTLSLASGTSNKVDVKAAGNVAHIFFWKNAGSYLISVEYDPSTDTYKFWSQRKNKADVTLETGAQSATIDIDATGRMWLASVGGSSVNVRWSDSPYSTWSGPTTLATGLTATDLCAVVAIPSTNKVGVFWSNKNSKRFGFKTHTDGADPLVWSSDEAPGAESALNIGAGFADHQFNLKATESGTLYSAIKTNYNTANNPQIALMVRSAGGTWSTPYTVTQQEGTHPMLLLNESMNKLKVIYSLSGSVSYKESPINAISFGQPLILINGSNTNSTSAKAPYSSEAVIIASSGTNAASVKGIDAPPSVDNTPPTVVSINRQAPASNPTNATSVTFRATFSEPVTGVNATDFALTSTGTATGTISTVTAISTSVYDVTISSVAGDGTLRIDLNGSGTGITDIAGNNITGGFTSETFTIQQGGPALPGFSSITPLSPINIADETKHKPQAKAWYYANQWWCVLSAIGGTKIYRLDGTNWTNVLSLTNRSADPDCWVVGNLVHILGHKRQAFLYTIEYDPILNNYKLWSQRPTSLDINLPPGNEVSTITVDGTGKLWLATDGISDIKVWWSAPPYTSWSAPITIATGIMDDDICALMALPNQGKIGIFWSDQTTKRFGFKTHSDVDSPTSWSADELPASQSAINNVGKGFADDHMSIVVASDGTLYCAAKTSYGKVGYPELILLVRRPSGTWDNAYPVQMYPGGTQPVVVLNEALNKVKVIYTTATNGGNIVYRESSTSAISFSAPFSLISSSTALYNYATSTHQTYNPNVVIIATEVSANPLKAISVLASDAPSSLRSIASAGSTISPDLNKLEAYPNPFVTNTNLTFRLKKSGYYSIITYDMQGRILRTLETGWGDAGDYVRNYKSGELPRGISILGLKTTDGISTIKIVQY